MNTKRDAIQKLQAFFTSTDRLLFFNGTHQNEKHPLAIAAASEFTSKPSTILFRTNSAANTGMFLQRLGVQKAPKPGESIRVGSHRLCVDTINPRSWSKTPRPIDIAIVYPTDALDGDEGDRCVEDLIGRNAKKICLVTWTDNKVMSWVNQFNPVRVTYDAEEERPDYHQRMREIEAETMADSTPKNLPDYAKSTPGDRLIELYCRQCGCKRWAGLNQSYPGIGAIRKAQAGEYQAKCLKCGTDATDNYNWYGVTGG